MTGCQGLIGECGDFELYSVVDRKPVEVTKSLTKCQQISLRVASQCMQQTALADVLCDI